MAEEVSTYFHNDRSEMLALLPPPPYARVLEIGCAAGTFIKALPADERWGIEPVASVAAQAEECGIKVLVGLYEDVEDRLPDAYFDLIIANDVIEHMRDHEQFLRDIRRKLASDGHLVVSVPNIRSLATLLRLVLMKDWKYMEDGVLDRTHMRFFTERSLRRCFAESGYEVESLAGLRSIFRVDAGIPVHKAMVNWVIAAGVIFLTLGHALDTRFLQFGLRAHAQRPPNQRNP